MVAENELGLAKWLGLLLNLLSGLALMALMVVTCIDVVGRYLLNRPLVGATELIEIGLSVVVFAALPVISWKNDQIVVDILDSHISWWLHHAKAVLINIISAVALFYLGQRLIVLGNRALEYEEVSEYLHIPTGWGINFMGYMCWFTALSMLTLGLLVIRNQYRKGVPS